MNAARPRTGIALPALIVMAGLMLVLGVLLASGDDGSVPPGFVQGLLMSTQSALAACAALLSRGEFAGARSVVRARVAPLAVLRRAQRRHARELAMLWLLCAAPLLLIGTSWSQRLGGPALLALLMAGITVTAEWGRALRPELQRAWLAWRARWRWLDGRRQGLSRLFGLLPIVLTQTTFLTVNVPATHLLYRRQS